MHPVSITNCANFIRKYLDINDFLTILDIGSFNINGTLRPLFTYNSHCCTYCAAVKVGLENETLKCTNSYNCFANEPMKYMFCHDGSGPVSIPLKPEEIGRNWNYYGLDLLDGCKYYGAISTDNTGFLEKDKNVRFNIDFFMPAEDIIPLRDNFADVLVSNDCFEHSLNFPKTILEMIRVANHESLIFLSVPSSGPYHGFPDDFWRFKPGAYEEIERWFSSLILLETYINNQGTWKSNIGIFLVNKNVASLPFCGNLNEKYFHRVVK